MSGGAQVNGESVNEIVKASEVNNLSKTNSVQHQQQNNNKNIRFDTGKSAIEMSESVNNSNGKNNSTTTNGNNQNKAGAHGPGVKPAHGLGVSPVTGTEDDDDLDEESASAVQGNSTSATAGKNGTMPAPSSSGADPEADPEASKNSVGAFGIKKLGKKIRLRRKKDKQKTENRAKKALKTISFILGAFVTCWTPYHIIAIVASFCPSCINVHIYMVSYFLCYLNSPVNPFCYAAANQQFKNAFKRIMTGDLSLK